MSHESGHRGLSVTDLDTGKKLLNGLMRRKTKKHLAAVGNSSIHAGFGMRCLVKLWPRILELNIWVLP